jgi:hypothetical protein
MAIMVGQRRACCEDNANLVLRPHDVARETLHQCRVCGSKHYALEALPGRLGMQGAPMGGATIPPLSDEERLAFASAIAHERAAVLAKVEVVRRILVARGLDPAAVYDFLPDGVIRPTE